jgi:hypothetical protein
MTDRIDALYEDVKPEPYHPTWPVRPDEEKDRMRELRRQLAKVPAAMHHLGGIRNDDRYGPVVREMQALQLVHGARIRDAGIPRHVLAAATNPATGRPPLTQLRGWDDRDAALKFWKKAYCA